MGTHINKAVTSRRLAALALLMLPAIAMGREAVQCADVDWWSKGYDSGVRGEPNHWISRQETTCGADFRREEFLAGRRVGLVQFCRPEKGYQLGAKGRLYYGACPPHLEVYFLPAYRQGKSLADLKDRIRVLDLQIEWYEAKLAEIDRSAERQRPRGTAISEEEMAKRTRYRDELKGELEALERSRAAYLAGLEEYQ